jgi:hypothetical protein
MAGSRLLWCPKCYEPLSIDLTHDAEYGAALVDETHLGQLARNLPQRPSVTLGGSTGEAFCRKD